MSWKTILRIILSEVFEDDLSKEFISKDRSGSNTFMRMMRGEKDK